jgi:signal transduction histidine kinase
LETTVARAAESYGKESISIRCDTGPVEIFADPMIGQVFYNLIDNSLRHGGEKITGIRLSVLKDGPDLLMVYEDDGNGVLPEEKEKIFLKGFGKHTGLGMFLIKEILAITGITIRENGVQGNGVRFETRFP